MRREAEAAARAEQQHGGELDGDTVEQLAQRARVRLGRCHQAGQVDGELALRLRRPHRVALRLRLREQLAEQLRRIHVERPARRQGLLGLGVVTARVDGDGQHGLEHAVAPHALVGAARHPHGQRGVVGGAQLVGHDGVEQVQPGRLGAHCRLLVLRIGAQQHEHHLPSHAQPRPPLLEHALDDAHVLALQRSVVVLAELEELLEQVRHERRRRVVGRQRVGGPRAHEREQVARQVVQAVLAVGAGTQRVGERVEDQL